jgi:hypothetical protein
MNIPFNELIEKQYVSNIVYFDRKKYAFVGHPGKKYTGSLSTGAIYIFKLEDQEYKYFATIESDSSEIETRKSFGKFFKVKNKKLIVAENEDDLNYDDEYVNTQYSLENMEIFQVIESLKVFDIHQYLVRYKNFIISATNIDKYKFSEDKSRLLLCIRDNHESDYYKINLFNFKNKTRLEIDNNLDPYSEILNFEVSSDDKVVCVELNGENKVYKKSTYTRVFIRDFFNSWQEIANHSSGFVSMLSDRQILCSDGQIIDASEIADTKYDKDEFEEELEDNEDEDEDEEYDDDY